MAERKSPAAPTDGRVRAIIDALRPGVDGDRFAIKRIEEWPQTMPLEAHRERAGRKNHLE